MNFPNSPSVGTSYEAPNGLSYRYDGEKWTSLGSTLTTDYVRADVFNALVARVEALENA